jgi:hypothetical protein
MAAAATVTATLDRSTYAPGDRMELTVVYAAPGSQPNTAALAVTDDSHRTWTYVSDDGATAVFRAVA